MSYRFLLVGSKWAAIIVGYTLGSVLLSALLSFAIIIALSGGNLDDAPGNGFGFLIFFCIIFPVCLFLGLFYFVELFHVRIRKQERLLWRHVCLRWVLGIASITGPLWVAIVWPPAAYRSRFQSPAVLLIIYVVSICLFLLAIWMKFRNPSQAD